MHKIFITLLLLFGLTTLSQAVVSWQPAYAQTTGTSLTLYDNKINPAFYDGSFDYVSRNTCDQDTYTSASCSYAIALEESGGLNFIRVNTTLNTSLYKSLDFNVYTGGQDISQFAALFIDKDGESLEYVHIKSDYTNNLTTSYVAHTFGPGWVHVSIPINKLNPSNKQILSIQIKNEGDDEAETIWLDDIKLIAAGSSSVSAAWTPTTVDTTTQTPAPAKDIRANPLISRNVPAFGSTGNSPLFANDKDYNTYFRATVPGWLAYDLSSIPSAKRQKVMLAWYGDPVTYAYDHAMAGELGNNNLGDYVIEANNAPGGAKTAPDNGWVTLANVQNNTKHSRQHYLNFAGYNWVRIRVTRADGSATNKDAMFNMDIHDASAGISDSWIFFGEHITAGGMHHAPVNGVGSFAQLVNAGNPAYYPIQEAGGMGGWPAQRGAENMASFLAGFPGRYVALSYGTKDSIDGCKPEKMTAFYDSYKSMVDTVLKAGKVPVVPTIPWGRMANVQRCGPQYNEQIKKLYADSSVGPKIVRGPDLWDFFSKNQDLISQNDVHPTSIGYGEYRKLWANTALKTIYPATKPSQTSQQQTTSPTTSSSTSNTAASSSSSSSSSQGSTTSTTSTTQSTPTQTQDTSGPLPGRQIWKDGVSSYVFGATDTGEWNTPNFLFTDSLVAPGKANTVIQEQVKKGGITLVRKFIPHHHFDLDEETTDATLKAISTAMTNAGTQCLINLTSIVSPDAKNSGDKYTNLEFIKHVVTLFDGKHDGYLKCNLFEIGNEFDLEDEITTDQYIELWNLYVTNLKKIRPDAKFIGPVIFQYDRAIIDTFLKTIVKKNYPLPDAISWHWYPCDDGPSSWPTCLVRSFDGSSYDDVYNATVDIRKIIKNATGRDLPIGITEWSADPHSYPQASGNMSYTEPQMSQFITKALDAMIRGKLDFANLFAIQSGAAEGGLDIFDKSNKPRPYFNTFVNTILKYKQ